MLTLQGIARAMGGEVVSGGVSAPGPGHSKNDRSLRVLPDWQAPDGIRVHSLAGDDWRAALDYVKARLGIADRGRQRSPQVRQSAISKPVNNSERIARALRKWGEARPISDTPAMTYLARRGIDMQALSDMHHVLRWHPSCPWEGEYCGCILALFTDAVTNEPRAIHRTAINAAGQKMGRKMLGPVAGCVIRLCADETVTNGLGIVEGIENSLSALEPGRQPIWACGSAGAIASFPALAGIESLTVFADHDNVGIKAARQCRTRWQAAGRECVILHPPAAKSDLNDLTRAS